MKKYLLLLFLQVLFNKNDFIQAQWVQTNGPGGARVLSFAIRDNNIFAGTYGGIHLSTDNGLTWNAINNGLPENTSFISMAIKDNIVWAGTYGKGIFLSTNGGLNWSSANDGLPVEYAWINGLVFSRDTVFAGIYTGNYGEVYISTDYGESWGSVSNGLPKFNNLKALSISRNRLVAATSKGIYLSVDNGLHWLPADSSITEKYSVISLAVQGDTIYAGSDFGGEGIFRSLDGGISWKLLSTGYREASVPALTICGSNIFAAISGHGIILSTDNGATWNSADSGLPALNINTLAVIENSIFAGTEGGGIFASSDKGLNWNTANNGINKSSAVSMILYNGTLFAGTSTGIFSSSDNGEKWIPRNYGMDRSFVTSFAFSGDNIFAMTKNGISRSTDDGASWFGVNDGIHGSNFNAIAVMGDHIFAGTDSGAFLSMDEGLHWNAVNNGLHTTLDPVLNVSVLAANGNLIFAGASGVSGGGGFFFSTNYGSNWVEANNGLNVATRVDVNSLVFAGGKIFASYNYGFMHHPSVIWSADSGKSWSNINKGLPLYDITTRAFYVVENKIFAVTDEGTFLFFKDSTTWINADKNFPGEILSLVYDNNYVFAGTNGLGIWRRPLSEIATIPPGIPGLLSVKNNSKNQPVSLTLAWNEVPAADTYHLQISRDSIFKDLQMDDSALTSSSKNVSGLREGRIYYWRVRARNSAGESDWSQKWNFTTLLNNPDSLSATVINSKKVRLIWKDRSAAEAGFIIERKESSDFYTLDTLKNNQISYIDSTIRQFISYQYRIKAYTQFAVSAYSNLVLVKITNINNNNLIPTVYSLLQNYPNPFNPVTSIRYGLPVESTVKLVIYNLIGETVQELVNFTQSAGFHEIAFNADGISSGVYFYSLEARATNSSQNYKGIKKMIVLK